jgi:hypothetical protein
MDTKRIKVIIGSGNIGKTNFAYWSEKPIIPTEHHVIFVPQSIFDSWEAYCECGEWAASASAWGVPTRDENIAALTDAHEKHKSGRRPKIFATA